MARLTNKLPQLSGRRCLADGGLETTLIFHDGIDLPHFASFDLLRDVDGRNIIKRYYERYFEIAKRENYGFILDSPTWRANPDWGAKLGYSKSALDAINRDAIELMKELRDAYQSPAMPVVISGCIGPRGDGYVAGEMMTVAEAQAYHSGQIAVFADSGADMVAAFTMTNTNEAIGIIFAAQYYRMPVAISFTLETDGRLPSGQALREAIELVDAATSGGPDYYMINCAHPEHFTSILLEGGAWTRRILGIRANASRRSHAELNEAPDLDDGNPAELGRQYADLLVRFPHLTVFGGCCGTDHRHVDCIVSACKIAA